MRCVLKKFMCCHSFDWVQTLKYMIVLIPFEIVFTQWHKFRVGRHPVPHSIYPNPRTESPDATAVGRRGVDRPKGQGLFSRWLPPSTRVQVPPPLTATSKVRCLTASFKSATPAASWRTSQSGAGDDDVVKFVEFLNGTDVETKGKALFGILSFWFVNLWNRVAVWMVVGARESEQE